MRDELFRVNPETQKEVEDHLTAFTLIESAVNDGPDPEEPPSSPVRPS